MPLVTADISVSSDGFSAGPNQREDAPFGDGVDESFHDWQTTYADDNRRERDGILDAGAFIMGRNMFSPFRGPWTDDWRGWWGDDPPYHAPVFVLTHHPRTPLEMQGGTTFHFVTDGAEAALARAREAAGDRNVAVAGGASTINEFIARGLLDELRLHIAPVAFGLGARGDVVRVFDGVPRQRMEPVYVRSTPHTTHITYRFG